MLKCWKIGVPIF